GRGAASGRRDGPRARAAGLGGRRRDAPPATRHGPGGDVLVDRGRDGAAQRRVLARAVGEVPHRRTVLGGPRGARTARAWRRGDQPRGRAPCAPRAARHLALARLPVSQLASDSWGSVSVSAWPLA